MILSCWAILHSTFTFRMDNIIITIMIHHKGRFLWSVTTAYIDKSFFAGGSHMFLLVCEEILKKYNFFFPQYCIQEKHCLHLFLQLTFRDISQTQLLLCAVGAFQGEQWTHENGQSLSSFCCLMQQKALETPEQLLPSPSTGHCLVLWRLLVCRVFATQQLLGE